jgi:hypothetical protein
LNTSLCEIGFVLDRSALLDAIGRTISPIGERLDRTPEPNRPGKVIAAILTDGLENASQVRS